MKRQLLPQLPVLLEQLAAQHRLGRSAGRRSLEANARHSLAATKAMFLGCTSRRRSSAVELATNLVLGNRIEYAWPWMMRSWRSGSGGCGVWFGINSLHPKHPLPERPSKKCR